MKRFNFVNFFLKGLGVATFMAVAGCAGSTNLQINALEERLDEAQSENQARHEALSGELQASGTRINEVEVKLDFLEHHLNMNPKEAYLKVRVENLNIRTGPTTRLNNIIAKADKGAYLRRIEFTDSTRAWQKVAFMIEHYPYIGYVVSDPEFVDEQYMDAMTFSRVYQRNLIKYLWETEAAAEMRQKGIGTIGVAINAEAPYNPERFLSHLAKMFHPYRIYVKPIEGFAMRDVSKLCSRYDVGGILSVDIIPAGQEPGLLEIRLFEKTSLILYAVSLPLQAVEVPDVLGRR